MTKSKCAEVLQAVKFMLNLSDYSDEVEEALDMAIEEMHKGGYEAGYDRGLKAGVAIRERKDRTNVV